MRERWDGGAQHTHFEVLPATRLEGGRKKTCGQVVENRLGLHLFSSCHIL